MNSPKISIIIPVYNTEKYVKDALLSICNQTIRDIEIIVIDDGSTDDSLRVVESVAELDDRIFVHTQQNKGQSEARNVGLTKSNGEYIYFMDSDDLLDHDALMCCYEVCHTNNLDFVFFDATAFSEKANLLLNFNYQRTEYIDNKIYTGIDLLDIMLKKKFYLASVWLNLIKRDFLQQLQLYFYPGIIHEDELFTAILYIKAQRIGFVPRAFFKRRFREDSIMTQSYSYKNIKGYLTVVNELLAYVQDADQQVKTIVDRLVRYILNPAIYNSHVLNFHERLYIFKQIVRLRKYISRKNLLVLLFPTFIDIKSLFKKK